MDILQRLIRKNEVSSETTQRSLMFGNFRSLYISSTVGKVSGNVTVIRGQVRNLIGLCDGNHLHMISKS